MSKKFENSVDRFDNGESKSMEEDERLIQQISDAARAVGENDLRKEIQEISKSYHGKKGGVQLWYIGIAATLVVLVGAVFYLRGDDENTPIDMQIDQAPILMDSATYEQDSVLSEPADSIELKKDIKE